MAARILKIELVRMSQIPASKVPRQGARIAPRSGGAPPARALQRGFVGDDVSAVQRLLVKQGFAQKRDFEGGLGVFGPRMEYYVGVAQTAYGMKRTGVADAKLLAALANPATPRVQPAVARPDGFSDEGSSSAVAALRGAPVSRGSAPSTHDEATAPMCEPLASGPNVRTGSNTS